ncbi:MAG: hypothetical protein WC475_03375 [Candidatus Paceibacterota bacterium]
MEKRRLCALVLFTLILASFSMMLADAKGIPEVSCPSNCEIRTAVPTDFNVSIKNIGLTDATFNTNIYCEDEIDAELGAHNVGLKPQEKEYLEFTAEAAVNHAITETCVFKATTSDLETEVNCTFSCRAIPNFCTEGEVKCSEDKTAVTECTDGAFANFPCEENQICENGKCADAGKIKSSSSKGILIAAIIIAAILIAAFFVLSHMKKKRGRFIFLKQKRK